MKKSFNGFFECYMYELLIGEYMATDEKNVIIKTVLGSCVAVCLTDKKAGVIGMNHFMMPGKYEKPHDGKNCNPKYGVCSLDKLITAMLAKGAHKKSIEAKVYGGGNITGRQLMNINKDNIDFVTKRLQELGIKVKVSDTGGRYTRKIHFFSKDSKVLLEKNKSLIETCGEGDFEGYCQQH